MSELAGCEEPAATHKAAADIASLSRGKDPEASASGDSPSSTNPAIAEDHTFFRTNLPDAAVLTLNKEYCTVVIM